MLGIMCMLHFNYPVAKFSREILQYEGCSINLRKSAVKQSNLHILSYNLVLWKFHNHPVCTPNYGKIQKFCHILIVVWKSTDLELGSNLLVNEILRVILWNLLSEDHIPFKLSGYHFLSFKSYLNNIIHITEI